MMCIACVEYARGRITKDELFKLVSEPNNSSQQDPNMEHKFKLQGVFTDDKEFEAEVKRGVKKERWI